MTPVAGISKKMRAVSLPSPRMRKHSRLNLIEFLSTLMFKKKRGSFIMALLSTYPHITQLNRQIREQLADFFHTEHMVAVVFFLNTTRTLETEVFATSHVDRFEPKPRLKDRIGPT